MRIVAGQFRFMHQRPVSAGRSPVGSVGAIFVGASMPFSFARRPMISTARRPAGTLPFTNSDSAFENSWSRRAFSSAIRSPRCNSVSRSRSSISAVTSSQAVLVETCWIFFMARSMLMPFASAYACARSSVSFSAMTR